MKVLLAAHQFFPESRAGTEVLVLEFAKALIARGHEPAVFAPRRSTPFSDLQPYETEDYAFDGMAVRRAGRSRESLSRPFRLNYDDPEMAAKLARFAEEFRPDVVHFWHLQGLSAAAIPPVKKLGLPALYTATDFWAACPVVDLRRHDGAMCGGPDPGHCPRCLASRQSGSRLAGLLQRTPGPFLRAADTLARAPLPAKPLPLRQIRDLSERPAFIRERVNSLDRIIAPTGHTRSLLVRNGVKPDLVTVSRYGIDTSDIPRTRHDSVPSPVRFGFIGTLGPHKGCDSLIRAFRNLPGNADATLTIHGPDGGFEDFAAGLKRLAAGDGRITFAGSFAPEEIGAVLGGMDVLVVPSRWYENSPVVIYEALAAGIPVIATDLGGMSEVVEHGKNGLLFPLDDEAELGRLLMMLARDPERIARLREGIEPVKTADESAREMEELYESLVSGGRVP